MLSSLWFTNFCHGPETSEEDYICRTVSGKPPRSSACKEKCNIHLKCKQTGYHRGLSSLGELRSNWKKFLKISSGHRFKHGPSADIAGCYVCAPCMIVVSERAVNTCCAHQAPKRGRAKTLAVGLPALVGILCGTAILSNCIGGIEGVCLLSAASMSHPLSTSNLMWSFSKGFCHAWDGNNFRGLFDLKAVTSKHMPLHAHVRLDVCLPLIQKELC